MSYRIALLPGDGIGPEVLAQARRVLDCVASRAGVDFAFEEIPCGGRYYLEHGGRDWPEGSEERCAAADLILLGAVGWPKPDGTGPITMPDGRMAGWSAVLGNRMRLDLYANVRPVKLLAGVRQRIHGKSMQVWEPGKVDLVIVRENTEDLYAGMGGLLAPGGRGTVAIDTRVITRAGCERIIRFAFELCRKRARGAPADGRRRVTSIAKDNVLAGCRFFNEIFFEIGRDYADIDKETVIVDAFTQALVTAPEHFDVCVTTNLFGDIVTDLAAVLQGGMGMAVGCNLGERHGMFEPIHGSAPTHAPDTANPLAMILAAAAGLRWLGEKRHDPRLGRAAEAIESAVAAVVAAGAPLTYDLVGPEHAAPMSAVGAAVCEQAAQRL
jgi:isocitrate/isopropylmalate dehydrogenase